MTYLLLAIIVTLWLAGYALSLVLTHEMGHRDHTLERHFIGVVWPLIVIAFFAHCVIKALIERAREARA